MPDPQESSTTARAGPSNLRQRFTHRLDELGDRVEELSVKLRRQVRGS